VWFLFLSLVHLWAGNFPKSFVVFDFSVIDLAITAALAVTRARYGVSVWHRLSGSVADLMIPFHLIFCTLSIFIGFYFVFIASYPLLCMNTFRFSCTLLSIRNFCAFYFFIAKAGVLLTLFMPIFFWLVIWLTGLGPPRSLLVSTLVYCFHVPRPEGCVSIWVTVTENLGALCTNCTGVQSTIVLVLGQRWPSRCWPILVRCAGNIVWRVTVGRQVAV